MCILLAKQLLDVWLKYCLESKRGYGDSLWIVDVICSSSVPH